MYCILSGSFENSQVMKWVQELKQQRKNAADVMPAEPGKVHIV